MRSSCCKSRRIRFGFAAAAAPAAVVAAAVAIGPSVTEKMLNQIRNQAITVN